MKEVSRRNVGTHLYLDYKSRLLDYCTIRQGNCRSVASEWVDIRGTFTTPHIP